MDFAPYFSPCSPSTPWANELEPPRDDLDPLEGDPLHMGSPTYGADAHGFNLGRGPLLFPFLKGGGGIPPGRPRWRGADRSDSSSATAVGSGSVLGQPRRRGADGPEVDHEALGALRGRGRVRTTTFPTTDWVGSWCTAPGSGFPWERTSTTAASGVLVPGIAVEPFAVRTDYADEPGLDRQLRSGFSGQGWTSTRMSGSAPHYWRGVN